MTSESEHKQTRNSFLAVPLTRLVAFVLNHRAMVFIMALLFAGASLYLSGNHLRFKNRRLDLINPNSEWNVFWKEYTAKFGSDDDIYVVVDGDTPTDITAALDRLAAKIETRDDLFYSLFYKVDDAKLFSKGLHLAPDEEIRGMQLFLASMQGVLRGQWEDMALDRMMANSVLPLTAPPGALPETMRVESKKHMECLVTSLEGAFGEEYRYVSPWPEMDVDSRRNVNTSNPHHFHKTRQKTGGMMAMLPSARSRVFTPSESNSPMLMADANPEEGFPAKTNPAVGASASGFTPEILPFGSYMAHYPDFSASEASEAADAAVMDPFRSYQQPNAVPAPTHRRIGHETPVMLPDLAPASAPQANPAVSPGSNMHYFWLSDTKKTATLMIKLRMLKGEEESFARGTAGVDCLREMIAEVRDEMRLADGKDRVTLQLTGLPVIENDEMRSSEDGMSQATFLAVVGITVLYIVFFGGLRHPLLAMTALMFGIAWSMGFITIAVGHLNILSISFGVILVGLGIDFGIHLTTRYVECRRQGDDAFKGIVRAVYEVGPGVLTGGITTTMAFMMAGFTEFQGVKELGIIAGGGVLLCCLAAFVILPILIYTSDKNRSADKLPVPKNPNTFLAFFQFRPKMTMVMIVVLVGVLGYGAQYSEYDYNLLNLLPEDLESVELEHRLIDQTDQGSWYALSMSSDRKELLERMEQFLALDSVCNVEQILTIIPEENPQRTADITAIHSSLQYLPTDVKPVFDAQRVLSATTKEEMDEELRLKSIGQSFEQMLAYLQNNTEYQQLYHRVQKLYGDFCNMEVKTAYLPRIERFQQQLGEDVLTRLRTIRSISNPEPPTLADIPQALVDRFMATDPVTGEQTYLLKVFGTGNLWDMDNLKKFVDDVNGVDKNATGNPIQTYHCSLQMQKCYIEAAIYALAAVMFFLYIDLRSIRQTLLALLPVGLGMLQMCGIMGYLGIAFNAANMIVLPLIIGIGIDDGIHVLHDFRHQHGKSFYRLSPSTCMSVILTSFTTIMGFGTLMVASHRGLQSLGLVLSLGIFCCLYTSVLILPALLTLFCRFAEDGIDLESREDEEKLITQSIRQIQELAAATAVQAPVVAVAPAAPAPRLPSEIFREATAKMAEPALSPTPAATPPESENAQDDQPAQVGTVRISRYVTATNGEVIHSTTTASPMISSLLQDNRAA